MKILTVTAVLTAATGVVLAGPPSCSAQAQETLRADIEVGIGGWSGQVALFGSLGVDLSNSVVGVTLSPLAALMRAGEGEPRRYVERRVGGGETECVDREMGTIFPELFCSFLGSTVVWAPNAELYLSAESVGVPLRFGVGVRGGTDDPLTWSVGYVSHRSERLQWRFRALYSQDAWHFGVGGTIPW